MTIDQDVINQKREKLLDDLRAGLTIKAACGQARISRQTYYNWIEESGPDGEWTLECAAARTTPQAQMTNVLIEQGLQGDWRSAHTFLKSAAPDEWSDRREVELNVSDSTNAGDDLVKDMIEQLRYELVADNESDDDDDDDDATIDP
ncbi:helix-turn-helix domain-containing protein [uncultured Idiomarina sp.]|uniref:helix-turn-helix domain-containing protein n=1 Tax=uncultured Idiomarina sp. TaxID=352961 RepID=UPI0032B13575|tara:strand:- start:7679 stop:8119 length:441 start_codon:yes stop_codon:yes gene_type:complete